MAVALHILFIVFFISLPYITAASNPNRFAVKLIHRHSPLSPFNKMKDSAHFDSEEDIVLKRSLSRYAYLSATQQHASTKNGVRTGQIPDGSEFLAKLSIGTPPLNIFIVMDTGSNGLWTQCEPCLDCYPQTEPIYDRTKSSTYVNLSCHSHSCNLLHIKECDNQNNCLYDVTYFDGDSSYGYLANEVLTFIAPDGTIETPKVAFGCGFKNKYRIPGHAAGILGLGADDLSLVYQLTSAAERKFSYCFGNLSDPLSEGNLIIGEGSYTSGYETPLEPQYYYYLKLIAISVGNKRLEIPPVEFERSSLGDGGVIIDNGSKLTFLVPTAYLKLEMALMEQLEKYFQRTQARDSVYDKRLCYIGRIGRDLEGFPLVMFNFAGGADLVLEKWSSFQQVKDEIFCLAFYMSPDGLNIIGNMAQQFYNIGFDLVKNVLTFQDIDCSLI